MGARASWLLGVALAACSTTPPVVMRPPSGRSAACRVATPVEAPVRLPVGFYSLPTDRFAEVADAGVTMVGPYYGTPPSSEVLDAAAAQGLGVVYPIGFERVRGHDARPEIEAQIDAVVEHEAVVAWYVLPEETRPWVELERLYPAWIREVVRARDPAGRPLLSYQPNHRDRGTLARASASFDVVTRGLYANFVGLPRAWVRNGAAVITAASGPGQTPWAVLEMFQQPDPGDVDSIRDWVRHDVYASLLAGARGILVFSGWPRQGFDAYELYLAAYLDVVRELNGPAGLAIPLLRGEPQRRFVVRIVGDAPVVDIGTREHPLRVPGLDWREVAVNGTSWLYLVNSSQRSVEVRLEAPCAIETVLGPAPVRDALVLPPLGVAVLRTPTM